MTRFDFSTLWGSKDQPATEESSPFQTDAEAKLARDLSYSVAKGIGLPVRRSTLRNQIRQEWAWGVRGEGGGGGESYRHPCYRQTRYNSQPTRMNA